MAPGSPTSSTGSCARSASRITAVALALSLAFGLPLALLAYDWARVFFDPQRMSQAVGQELLDSGVLRQMASDALLRGGQGLEGQGAVGPDAEGPPSEEPGMQVFRHLDEAGRQQLLDILIPRGWAQDQLSRLMRDLYGWFDDDDPRPELTLDIGPVKERLLSGGAREVVALVLDSWPACSPDQLLQLGRDGAGWENLPDDLQCSPPEPMRSAMLEQGALLIQRQFQPLPTVIPLGDSSNPSGIEDAGRLKQGIRLVRALARWGWLIPLSTLGLITAVAARSWPQLLRWWGGPLAGAGVGGLFLLLGAGALTRRMAVRVAGVSQLPAFLGQALRAVADHLLDDILGALLFESILLLLLGAALWGIGSYLGRRA